jgi:Uncharacterized protein conserved in bacteria (DUF2213)
MMIGSQFYAPEHLWSCVCKLPALRAYVAATHAGLPRRAYEIGDAARGIQCTCDDMTDHTDEARPLAAPRATPDGRRIFQGRAARVHRRGDPLRYPERGVDEYRSPTELRNVRDQMIGVPVTLGHPTDLLANGASAKIVGEVVGANVIDDHLVVDIAIDDAGVIAAFAHETPQLSLGYQSKVDALGNQSDTDVDHLAVLVGGTKARCGPTCSVRADSHDHMRLEDAGKRYMCDCNKDDDDTNTDDTTMDAAQRKLAVQAHRRRAEFTAHPDVEGVVDTLLRNKAYGAALDAMHASRLLSVQRAANHTLPDNTPNPSSREALLAQAARASAASPGGSASGDRDQHGAGQSVSASTRTDEDDAKFRMRVDAANAYKRGA